jgi:hypothetical protein
MFARLFSTRKRIYIWARINFILPRKVYILTTTKNYCLIKAFLALDGLPRFLFAPIGIVFASGGV